MTDRDKQLPLDVVDAATLISPHVWNQPYRAGDGPMHHARGPYWHNELRRRAQEWRLLAHAAEMCATELPHD